MALMHTETFFLDNFALRWVYQGCACVVQHQLQWCFAELPCMTVDQLAAWLRLDLPAGSGTTR